MSAPTAGSISNYATEIDQRDHPYKIAELTSGLDAAEAARFRSVIGRSRWDHRELLLQAASEAVAGSGVDGLALSTHTIDEHEGSTILGLHAVAEDQLIPVGWRRLTASEYDHEAQVTLDLTESGLVGLGLGWHDRSEPPPPVVCADLLGDERLRSLLAGLGLEYAIAMPAGYPRAALTAEPSSFSREHSILGHDLAERAGPVQLRNRPGSRLTGSGDEWACSGRRGDVPVLWLARPRPSTGHPYAASRERRRAEELVDLADRMPVESVALELGADLLRFADPSGWERDCIIRSLNKIFHDFFASTTEGGAS